MLKRPSLSIIIPVLNEEKHLPLLLTDLTQQTYKDFEVIIVDGQSEDKTIQKVLTFKKKLSSITILTSNLRNVCHQKNLGAKKAHGSYLLFMDADNRIPSYLLQGIKYRLDLTDADIFTNWLSPEDTKDVDSIIPTFLNYYVEIQKKSSSPFAVEALLGFKTKVFQSLKGFSIKVPTNEGNEIITRAVKKKFQFHVFRDPRYTYSFRRILRLGTLKAVSNAVQLELSRLLGVKIPKRKIRSLYPMEGGKYFEEENTSLFSKIKTFKLHKERQRLLKIIRQVLEGEV